MPFKLYRDLVQRIAGRNQFVNVNEPVVPNVPNRVTEQIAQSVDALLGAQVSAGLYVAGSEAGYEAQVSFSADSATVTFHRPFVVQSSFVRWDPDPSSVFAQLTITEGEYPAFLQVGWVADVNTTVTPANMTDVLITDFVTQLAALDPARLPFVRVIMRTHGFAEGTNDWVELAGGLIVRAGSTTTGGRQEQYAQAVAVDASLGALSDRADSAEGRLDAAEGRLDSAEGRLDSAEGRLSDVEGDFAGLASEIVTDSLVADSIVLGSPIPTPLVPFLSPLQDPPAVMGVAPLVPYPTTYTPAVTTVTGARAVVTDGEFIFVAARHTDGNLRILRASMFSDISDPGAFVTWCDVTQAVPSDANSGVRMWVSVGSSRVLVVGASFIGSFSRAGTPAPVFRSLGGTEAIVAAATFGTTAVLLKRESGLSEWETVDLSTMTATAFDETGAAIRGDADIVTTSTAVAAYLELDSPDTWRLVVDVLRPYDPVDPLSPEFEVLDTATSADQPFAVVGVRLTKRGVAVVYAKTESGNSSLYVQMLPVFFGGSETIDFRSALERPAPVKVGSQPGTIETIRLTQRGAQKNRFASADAARRSSHVIGDRNSDTLFVYWADILWTVSVAGVPRVTHAQAWGRTDSMDHSWAGILHVNASTGSVGITGDGTGAGFLVRTIDVDYGSQTQRIIKV